MASRVTPLAMRSMPECAASENMPSEPVRTPVTSLSSVMPRAAISEESAAARLAVLASLAGATGIVFEDTARRERGLRCFGERLWKIGAW